jgi:hypothetical protein
MKSTKVLLIANPATFVLINHCFDRKYIQFSITIYTVLDVNFPVISGVLIERIACERASEIENEIFSEIDALGEQICVVNSHFCGFSFGLILLGHFGWPTIHYQPQPLVLQCHKTPSDNGQHSYRALRLQYKTVGIVRHSEYRNWFQSLGEIMSATVCNVVLVVLRTPGESIKATAKIRRIVFTLHGALNVNLLVVINQ